jgi:hypothetical protein
MDIKANKEEFIRLLRSTEREGVEDLIPELERLGFFSAPASAGHHLNTEGGLVQHSLNVCRVALRLRDEMEALCPAIKGQCPDDSVILSSLLHDVCKADVYKRTVKKRKNALGQWEDTEGYRCSYRDFPMGHGEKSVYMISGFMKLTREEAMAIRWHMGFTEHDHIGQCGQAFEMFPLAFALSTADMMATYYVEGKS